LGSGFSKQWSAVPVARQQRMSVPAAIGLVLAIGALLGMIHGLFITKANLQPFVVTLCGLLIYRGFARWLVDDQVQGFGNEYDSSLGILANGKLVLFSSPDGTPVFGIPYMFFIMVITAILAAIFLNWTIWGRYIRALGRNEEAARYSGINTHRMIILAYIICTVLATVGGMLFAVDANSISPSGFGNFYELYAIAAAVLGGCSLRGGEGGIFGVVIGTAVMQLLKNLIVLKHINQTLEFVIIGVVLLVGVTADELIRRLVARRRALRQAKRLLEQQGTEEALATKPSDST
jgi:ribose transport system permease protein